MTLRAGHRSRSPRRPTPRTLWQPLLPGQAGGRAAGAAGAHAAHDLQHPRHLGAPGGTGRYTEAEIRDILVTATTGFRAARIEAELAMAAPSVVVSTGHWGTGAFGGDQVLMAALQAVAARLAGIDRLAYHTVDADGSEAYREGQRVVARLLPPGATPRVAGVVRALLEMGFAWGVSDGN